MTELRREVAEPCGICLCCKAGTRCAHVLWLDSTDAAALMKVQRVVGAGGGGGVSVSLKASSAIDRARRAAPEPMIKLECPKCGDDMEVFAYVVNTLKARGMSAPPCESCRYRGPERADLR